MLIDEIRAASIRWGLELQESWDGLKMWLSDHAANGFDWVAQSIWQEGLGLEPGTLAWTRSDSFTDWTGYAVAGVLVLLAVMILRRLRRRRASGMVSSLSGATRRPRIIGYATVAAFVVFLGGWSATAPLASAALAPGVVSPEGNRKTVEHLEGGIIREIHVREGDRVSLGDPLVTLADVQAKAHFTQLQDRLVHLQATEARLLAERSHKTDLVLPRELTQTKSPSVERAIAAQVELFQSGLATHAGRESILHSRIDQLHEQNAGLGDVLAAHEEQIDLLTREIAGVQALFDDGLERLPRLMALQRERAEAMADLALNKAKIAENNQKVGETKLQLLAMREQRIQEANDQLAEVERQMSELRSQLQSRADILDRTIIRAPIDGTVFNIRPTTVTGVIRPGEAILEIVPEAPTLVVDAKVRPNDIDRVHSGMQARVILSAYKQRNLPLIHGTLRSVSADRLIEDRTGEPYYLAKIDVNKDDLLALGSVQMIPGMPAEVMLLDTEQTFLEYLMSPLSQSFDRSFREN